MDLRQRRRPSGSLGFHPRYLLRGHKDESIEVLGSEGLAGIARGGVRVVGILVDSDGAIEVVAAALDVAWNLGKGDGGVLSKLLEPQ